MSFLPATVAATVLGADVWVTFKGADANPVWLDSWPPFQDPPDGYLTDDEYNGYIEYQRQQHVHPA